MSGGGEMKGRGVMNYEAPKGPIGIDHKGVDIGGHNCGKAGTQGATTCASDGASGSPGLHGTNHGKVGTQGRH